MAPPAGACGQVSEAGTVGLLRSHASPAGSLARDASNGACSSASACANSWYSKTSRSSRTCSSRVFSRSPYAFNTDA